VKSLIRNIVKKPAVLIIMTSRVTVFVKPTNNTKLMKIIINLNNSKSPGYDNIGPSLIKDVSTVILDLLVYSTE